MFIRVKKLLLNFSRVLLKRLESSQLFELYVSSNPKDPRHNLLRLSQASWFFNREYLNNTAVMQAYKEFTLNSIKYMKPLSTNLTSEIKSMLDLEMQFELVRIHLNEAFFFLLYLN